MKDQPAFPSFEAGLPVPGMTLRDYLAGQAITGILAGISTGHQISKPGNPIPIDESVIMAAWQTADLMLENRTKK